MGGWGLDGILGSPWVLSLSAGPAAWPSVWCPACSFRRLLSPPPPAPASGAWLFPFNIHLEMPNLGSWKPTPRVKFLATCKVFHFPPV